MAEYDVYVVGMRKEMFVDEGPGDSAWDINEPMENENYVLFCVTCEGRVKFTIDLSETYGWCGSGWTTASWGNMSFKRVNNFGPATHMPKERKIKIEGVKYDDSRNSIGDCLNFSSVYEDEEEYYGDIDIANNVFSFSSDGGDGYYPCGHVHVYEELFNKLSRAFDKMPVWILNGASGTGKSTFGYILEESGKTVYETDSANNGKLPDEIWADVIVVGNKWKNITVEEVEKHLPEDCKAVNVKFSF